MFNYIGILLVIFLSFPVFADDPPLYRADSRSPEDIQATNGFNPRGFEEYFSRNRPMNINLFTHAQGTQTGMARDNDGYVSTSYSMRSAHVVGQTILSGYPRYYIYVIATAPNLIDVNEVLGRFSPHPDEHEVAALGGIPWSQVMGWYTVTSGVISESMTQNRAYRPSLYENLHITPAWDAYQFAGFPIDHNAWRQFPWHNFVDLCGVPRIVKRSTTVNRKELDAQACLQAQSKNAYQYLENVRSLMHVSKIVKKSETTTSNSMVFPLHDYPHKWVDLDGLGNQSYCGFNTDANSDKKYITCLRNLGNFHFQTTAVVLPDYGWGAGQDFVDGDGDGKTDYCRLQYNWTHPVCSLSTIEKPFSVNQEGEYVNAGYDSSRHWTNISNHKSNLCRQISSTQTTCSDLTGNSSDFNDDDSGWANSRIWLDIDGNGEEDYCRLVYTWTHLRCNLHKKDNTWQTVETGYVDGGYSNLRFSLKMTYEHPHYCRVVGNHDYFHCSYINKDNKLEDYSVHLPFQIFDLGGTEFNDVDGDGRDDLCKYDPTNNAVNCYLNQDKQFDTNPIKLPLTGTPIAPLGNYSTKVIGSNKSSNQKSAVCYNVGYGTLYCDTFRIY